MKTRLKPQALLAIAGALMATQAAAQTNPASVRQSLQKDLNTFASAAMRHDSAALQSMLPKRFVFFVEPNRSLSRQEFLNGVVKTALSQDNLVVKIKIDKLDLAADGATGYATAITQGGVSDAAGKRRRLEVSEAIVFKWSHADGDYTLESAEQLRFTQKIDGKIVAASNP
ncbi:hypothetical protein CCAX7_27740 [Capsulimonas corticalis]|uniref:Uncharacterized protein n=1 Tax=Capsulimonas corticalis TaxID=2219043 RepID=A0A402CTJ3_9BACT|nr:hypothetical protein [Capsulimonas corticalis]BDI30723.1 hypothetical protein CCAX7_27740 [Capsulimonas corticalis]